jgi:hypothetical protein
MKKIMLAIATLLFALSFSAGTLAESKRVTQTDKKAAPYQDKVGITITDKRGQPIALESLPREDQARVGRAQKFAEKFVNEEPGGAGKVKSITIKCCPLEIDIRW